eukprot:7502216-Ditylum_brightwellii.AAC.1
MCIDVTKLKGIKENRKPRVWYDYFAKWHHYDKDGSLKDAWNDARNGEWNTDLKTGKLKYDDASINVI